MSTLRNKINEFEKNQTNLKTERAKEILQKDLKSKDKNSLQTERIKINKNFELQ